MLTNTVHKIITLVETLQFLNQEVLNKIPRSIYKISHLYKLISKMQNHLYIA